MPLLTEQYALPIHQAVPRSDGHEALLDSGAETPRAERSLRRKTPNGTLNAGYDATAEYSNPQKYQLMVSESNIPQLHRHLSESGKRTFLQHHQLQYGSNAAYGPQSASGWYAPPYQTPVPMPVMDSMYSQMPMQQFAPDPYLGQTVPSVMQPSLQYLGPTASGGQGTGLYGPYWHDGTYVPYRPAAIRDPRFYQQPSGGWVNPAHTPQLPQLWQTNNHYDQWSPNPLATRSQPAPQLQAAYPNSHAYSLGMPAPQAQYHTPIQHQHAGPWPAQSAKPASVAEGYGPASDAGRQRDRIFASALQQYRELLTFIHHTRRHQQNGRQGPGHDVQRPPFYPKPPKPSPAASRIQLDKRRAVSDSQVPQASREAAQSAGQRAVLDKIGGTRHAERAIDQSTKHVYDRRSSLNHRFQHYQDMPDYTRGSEHLPMDPYRTIRRGAKSASITPLMSPIPMQDSPQTRATTALSSLTKICRDGGWQWADGMLLGGCLAYALGDYEQAVRWYNKVLAAEPKHLEAASNLAASLLALGRRQEAEQHWTTVVKAAPNHFEAVEHLVGLLCQDQRSADAVKVIEYVENSLRQPPALDPPKASDKQSECSSSTASQSPCVSEQSDRAVYDFEGDSDHTPTALKDTGGSSEPGFGSSGFGIPGCDNGRMLALIHAKGNMMYGLGDNGGAARSFEDAVLIAAGRNFRNIQGLVEHILRVVSLSSPHAPRPRALSTDPVLLAPEQALNTARLCFPQLGELPGLQYVDGGLQSIARKAAISTTSNSLLSLAKIFQDGMSNTSRAIGVNQLACGVRDILALYYLSLALQPSPSTANNVGILLASVQQHAAQPGAQQQKVAIPGVLPGSGIALALQYYNYGLQLDQQHAHLYTNLGSLLKDIGQLDAAINMYERAVKCDGKFDIALANLANAVKDKGRISDAIGYYKRAVEVNPDFAEAVCGLANALNSVCSWEARGGVAEGAGKRDRWHVDQQGMLLDATMPGARSSGWIKRVVEIVQKQLVDGESWGRGTLNAPLIDDLVRQMSKIQLSDKDAKEREESLRKALTGWANHKWEGARLTRLIERATRRLGWQWYRDLYVEKRPTKPAAYDRPQLPTALTVPTAPTVLPFHTFTCPMSAEQIRMISQRNGLRISVSALRAPWLPKQVYMPPKPPSPYLKVGYVSSDFNNHPLAHLMQSVFGMHDRSRVKAYCYATTASDKSIHREQIEREAPVFCDASSWSAERLVNQIVLDGIHILVNLNGYTRGARNEIFAVRPAPIQMSFMGFAGTLGAEWCDYLLADNTAIPPSTLRPWRRNVDLEDILVDETNGSEHPDWIHGENIIFCRDTFFCCDHKQSAPSYQAKALSWDDEQKERWRMRKELFPQVTDETIIFANFNQLYKVSSSRKWASCSCAKDQPDRSYHIPDMATCPLQGQELHPVVAALS